MSATVTGEFFYLFFHLEIHSNGEVISFWPFFLYALEPKVYVVLLFGPFIKIIIIILSLLSWAFVFSLILYHN